MSKCGVIIKNNNNRKNKLLVLILIIVYGLLIIDHSHCIRVNFDLTFLENDESQRSCYSDGSSYVRGDISGLSSPPACDATDNDKLLNLPPEDCAGTCQAQDVITNVHTSIWKNQIIPTVQSILSDLVNFKSDYLMNNDTFLLDSTNSLQSRCKYTTEYGVPISSSKYKTLSNETLSGVDLVVFITMRPISMVVKGSGMMCLSQTMNNNSNGKRPVMGLINISTTYFNSLSPRSRIMLVLHMMYHIMGFNLKSFKEANLAVSSFTDTVNGESKKIFTLAAPKAIQEMRNHFSCQSSTDSASNYIALENADAILNYKYLYDMSDYEQGKNPLLESRIFFNELMSGSYLSNPPSDGPVPSRISLAVLDDLGYYNVNSSIDQVGSKLDSTYRINNERYSWGLSSQSCSIVTKRCENWDSKLSGYYCTSDVDSQGSALPMCTYDHSSKGSCDIVTFSTALSGYYVHISGKNTVGGRYEYRDYCPLVVKAGGSGECFKSANKPSDTTLLARTGQDYNANAGCFVGNLVSQASGLDYRTQSVTSRCYEYTCGPPDLNALNDPSTVDTHLFIKIGTYWLRCPQEGGEVSNQANAFDGKITCPKVDTLCAKNSTRTTNYSRDVADRDKNARTQQDIWKWAKDLSWWVWLIIGLAIGIVIFLICFVVVCCYCRKVFKKKGKWDTTKTINAREMDMHH